MECVTHLCAAITGLLQIYKKLQKIEAVSMLLSWLGC